jgi:predicted metal-dependent phosphoesterase TrpH
MSCLMMKWLLADLHIHSNFSDGLLSIEEIVKIYGKSGFDIIAITDHLFDTESQRSLELHEDLTSWKLLIFSEKEKESIREAIGGTKIVIADDERDV